MWPFKRKRAPRPAPTEPVPVTNVVRSVFERTTNPSVEWLRGNTLIEQEVTLADVYRCGTYAAGVDVLAESFAALPWHCYRKKGDSREAELTHPHARLVAAPSPGMTRFEWVECLVRSLCYHGNAYFRIERTPSGVITALVPLEAAKMTVVTTSAGKVGYRYAAEVLLAEEVFHLRWRSRDGVLGVPPWTEAGQSVSLALQEEQFAQRFFINGATVGGIIECPPGVDLSPEAKRLLLAEFNWGHHRIRITKHVKGMPPRRGRL